VAVLAADPDAECEPTRRQLRDGRELSGDGDRVPEREQVHPDVDRKLGLSCEQRGGTDEAVGTCSDEEADVIADAEMVDARVGDLAERGAPPLVIRAGHLQRVGEQPDTNTGGRGRICGHSPIEPEVSVLSHR
jgi:hypothetical protein